MTVEAAVPKTIFPSIAGIGPYAIGWPYGGTDVVVTVVKDGVRTVLTGADFSLSPTSSATAGSVFLTPVAATTHAGGQLIAERLTPEEQGWSGVYPGEKGIEAQLDRTTRRIQELSRQQAGAIRIDGEAQAGSVATDRVLMWDGTKIVPGPTADEIPAAQGYATAARKWAIEAVDVPVEPGLFSAMHYAFKAGESAAAALAAQQALSIPAPNGNVTDFLRANGTGYTLRTPAQVLAALPFNATFLTVGSLSLGAPAVKAADFALGATENGIINTKAGSSCVITLPAAASFVGREVLVVNAVAQAVVSAGANIVPQTGGAAGTSILPAILGAWARLRSDGANWRIMEAYVPPLGDGQTNQNVTASRALATTYTNTTRRAIFVSVAVDGSSVASSAMNFLVDGTLVARGPTSESTGAAWRALTNTLTYIVPPGATYRVDGVNGGTLNFWFELRT